MTTYVIPKGERATRKLSVTPFLISMLILSTMLVLALPVFAEGQSGTTLTAEVTAEGHWTRTFQWTIDKSVTPDTWDLFTGDSGTSQYTITVTKDSGTDEYWIEGTVSVTNGGAVATEDLQITIELRNGVPPPNDLIATASVDVSSNPVLDPGETGYYPYQVDIPSGNVHPGGTYKITALVTITNHSGNLGEPFGPSPSATTTLPSSPTLINDVIHVDDTNGGSWTFSASGSVSYEKTFTCDDEGENENTATIQETDQSDDATVTVNCYELEVTKDASTSFTRTYEWTIVKWADQTSLTLQIGEDYLVNYEVTVDATYTDSDWTVTGTISVYNPAPIPATINSISDLVSPDIAATVDFGVTFPYTLAAGETLTGTYSASLPDADTRTNTATATLQNYDYKWDGTETEAGTTDFSGEADVDFSEATINEVDECIDVSDDYAGFLGTVCYEDAPVTLKYSRTIGPYNEPGTYEVKNTASFVTNDTGTEGSDDWTVIVDVPIPPEEVSTISGIKFHDRNGNGQKDDGEEVLTGWTITLYKWDGTQWVQVGDPVTTDGDGYYEFSVDEEGTYRVYETLKQGWIQTKPSLTQDGSAYYEITVGEDELGNSFDSNDFGNIQRISTNARTIGYWKNWLPKFTNSYVLSLANGIKGSWNTFDSLIRTDTGAHARSDMLNILSGADAKDMSVMLKAQLLGMMLNIQAGYVNPSTLVYLGGINGASGLFGDNFKTAGYIVSFIDTNWTGWNRSTQEIAKNVLDAMNNNLIFVG